MHQSVQEVYDRLRSGPWPVDALVRVSEPYLDADEPGEHWFTVIWAVEHNAEGQTRLEMLMRWPGANGRPATKPLVICPPGAGSEFARALSIRETEACSSEPPE